LKNIYVAGDSYCFYRNDSEAHWPAILAKRLNCTLTGEGYPGQGWWPVKKNLTTYSISQEFNHTELFVICHTDPMRFLSDQPIDWSSFDLVKKIYETHIQSKSVSTWCVKHWYQELNQLLQGKLVVHLQCFAHDEFELLQGCKIMTSLLEMSVLDAGGLFTEPNYGGKQIIEKMNNSANHFSPKGNNQLVDLIMACINQR